jgi:hypothetical protein
MRASAHGPSYARPELTQQSFGYVTGYVPFSETNIDWVQRNKVFVAAVLELLRGIARHRLLVQYASLYYLLTPLSCAEHIPGDCQPNAPEVQISTMIHALIGSLESVSTLSVA